MQNMSGQGKGWFSMVTSKRTTGGPKSKLDQAVGGRLLQNSKKDTLE